MKRHSALDVVEHRPWPLPRGEWKWRQSWCELLFAHWRVPAAQLRPHIPASLEVDEMDGSAWLGVVPFVMRGVMRRPLPDLPWISAFPELNLRTYVKRDGKPGVWFFSLDAGNPLAVWAARRFFFLPYFNAQMAAETEGQRVSYHSLRRPGNVGFAAEYEPASDVYRSTPGSLEHWLSERYCLYARSPGGDLYRAEVHHHPWPLQRATVSIQRNDLVAAWGIAPDSAPELVHYSRRLDVVVWPLQPLEKLL